MDRTNALVLAGKIEARWFGKLPGAQLDVWIDELEALDEGAAGTAYARLKTNSKTTITPAEFTAEARRVNTTDASNRPTDCETCDNTGWTPAPDRIWPDDRHSDQWKPCTCPEGRKRQASTIWTERNHHRRQDAA